MADRVPEVVRRAAGDAPAELACVVTPRLAVKRLEADSLRTVVTWESWMVLEVEHLLRGRGEQERRGVADAMLSSPCREGDLVWALGRMRERCPGLWRCIGPVDEPRMLLGDAGRVTRLLDVLPPHQATGVLLSLVEHRDVAMALADAALGLEAELPAEVWHGVLRHGVEVGHEVARSAWKADEVHTERFLLEVWGRPIGLLLWSEAPSTVKVRLLERADGPAVGDALETESFRRELRRLIRTEPAVAEVAWRLLHRET